MILKKEMDENNKMDPSGQMPAMDQDQTNPGMDPVVGSDTPAMPDSGMDEVAVPVPKDACTQCGCVHKEDGSCDCSNCPVK